MVESVPPVDRFTAFVAQRAQALWRSAWLLAGDAQRAEDLVQTALAKTYPHFDRVSASGSFEAYVRKTMYRAYLAWWRRRWRDEVPADVGDPPVGSGTTAAEQRLDLANALAALPRAQKAVVVLRFYEDRSVEETAQLLGISTGTVKSHTSRALAALRRSPALAELEGVHDERR